MSTIKIKAPPDASYVYGWEVGQNEKVFTEQALAARDAQWQALVGPMAEALAKIAAIENQEYGADWEEIEQAREIAEAALSAITEE